MEDILGERMRAFGIVLRGSLPSHRWVLLIKDVTRSVGMNPVAEPTVFTYPIDGKGGTGQTIFMPITESFIVLDTWSDHDGAYLFINSCRPFLGNEVDLVAREFGLTTDRGPFGIFFHELRLT